MPLMETARKYTKNLPNRECHTILQKPPSHLNWCVLIGTHPRSGHSLRKSPGHVEGQSACAPTMPKTPTHNIEIVLCCCKFCSDSIKSRG